MQQVLNVRERNNAFLKFLLYFIITVCLVVVAVYFDFRVPREQNKKLLQASATQNEINDREEKFVVQMESISRLLDTLDKPGVDTKIFSSRIRDGINELYNQQNSENIFYDKLNKTVAEKFLALLREKEMVMEKEKELAALKAAKDLLQQQYDNIKNNAAPAQMIPNQ